MGGRKVVRRLSNQRLEAVGAALFPKPTINADGSFTIHDADENLSAALYDMKRLGADKVCINTVTKVLAQLYEARDALTQGRWARGVEAFRDGPSPEVKT